MAAGDQPRSGAVGAKLPRASDWTPTDQTSVTPSHFHFQVPQTPHARTRSHTLAHARTLCGCGGTREPEAFWTPSSGKARPARVHDVYDERSQPVANGNDAHKRRAIWAEHSAAPDATDADPDTAPIPIQCPAVPFSIVLDSWWCTGGTAWWHGHRPRQRDGHWAKRNSNQGNKRNGEQFVSVASLYWCGNAYSSGTRRSAQRLSAFAGPELRTPEIDMALRCRPQSQTPSGLCSGKQREFLAGTTDPIAAVPKLPVTDAAETEIRGTSTSGHDV
ncbi:uncharacterized protein MAM_07884 [Metarhizium album ARSEF 1941]|uniref:Uncharacterized protein n=1 Tax=Metarhizium album (strain ARSEF 1941) TaxID=1081103 RepID=A0A0B2WK25_METAS|nr:uncharacterized protein MAM_07884 [Metarhizium album ARSEF 1941]KHN94248.1 hypothetical protein MAM_07884 [Metarhizium album ARSEF 1941]